MSPFTRMYCVAFEEPRWMLWRGRPEAPGPLEGAAVMDGVPLDAPESREESPGVGRAQRLVPSGGTWLWYLDPIDESRTRLITRMRESYRWTNPLILPGQLAVDVGDFPFMRKVLLGIKARAEAMALRGPTGNVGPTSSDGP
jgi:hypothetical protein